MVGVGRAGGGCGGGDKYLLTGGCCSGNGEANIGGGLLKSGSESPTSGIVGGASGSRELDS